MSTVEKILVVGNGMVGHHFVEQLVKQAENSEDNTPFEITVLSAEPRLAYDRVHLSEYFSGKTADDFNEKKLLHVKFSNCIGM